MTEQITTLDGVEITPGLSIQEGIQQALKISHPLPDVAHLLGLARMGQNPLQAAARNFRDISTAAGFENAVQKGMSHEDAYAFLAVATGKNSAEGGPATESIRKSVSRGKKLLRSRLAKPKP